MPGLILGRLLGPAAFRLRLERQVGQQGKPWEGSLPAQGAFTEGRGTRQVFHADGTANLLASQWARAVGEIGGRD